MRYKDIQEITKSWMEDVEAAKKYRKIKNMMDMLRIEIATGIRYTPEGKGEAYLNIKDTGGVLLYEITKPYE